MSRRRLPNAATSNGETRVNNGSATSTSSRRHASRRATSFQQDSRQSASTRLQGPRGNRGQRNKLERISDVIEKERRGNSKKVTEQQIDTYETELEEAEEIIRNTDVHLSRLETQQVKKRLKHYNVRPLGDLSVEKPEGYNRFMMTQVNGMATPRIRDLKIDQSKRLINKYNVDMQAFLEVGMNWGDFLTSENLVSMFQAEEETRSVTGHNKHENPPSSHQQGGTGLVAVGEIIEYCKKSNSDY